MAEHVLKQYATSFGNRMYMRPEPNGECRVVKPKNKKLIEKNRAIIESARRTAEAYRKHKYLY